jgi:hypothetical protein
MNLFFGEFISFAIDGRDIFTEYPEIAGPQTVITYYYNDTPYTDLAESVIFHQVAIYSLT